MEYELLLVLARNHGRKLSRDEILSALRGIDAAILTRAVDIMVSRLRQKLGDSAKPARYGAMSAIRWVYSEDELREVISGHLSLHVDYVRQDIGNPPDIGRAVAITDKVPVDIRIVGPDLNWASDARFPQFEELTFGASRYFSDEPDAWLRELKNVEFAELDGHRFLKLEQGPYSIIVASPKIAVTQSSPDLLPIAAIQAAPVNIRHAVLKLSEVSLRDLASGLIEDFFARDRERIVVAIEGGGETVIVDESRLILLLKNLLGNALRYSRSSDGPVELTFERHAAQLEIRVRDHGPGIPPEQVAHLGEPFFRGDPSRTRGTGGSGLGLYLSKLVAEAHGGQLRLRDDIRDGACFEVVLPLAARAAGVRRMASG